MFLDTSGLLCLLHRPEPYHALASQLFAESSTFLVHDYVLSEFIALAHIRRVPRQKAIAYLRDLSDNAVIKKVFVDENLYRDGLRLLSERLDKTYSLCDAVSFVLMRARGETEALTTDGHFEQEGFKRLLKE